MTAPRRPEALATFAADCLAGRRAVVTGGGSGIGRATALLLASLGARVAIVGRRPDPLAEVAGLSPDVIAVPADIREPEEVDAALDQIMERLGGLDFLVNNAGGQFVAAAEQISLNGFRAVSRLNFESTWNLTVQAANRAMIPQAFGKIVSVTMTPRRGMPGMSHSSAARAGVESLMRTLAVEWGRHGIRTNAVAPGIVHTEAWERYGLDPAQVASVIPAGRLASADEVAAVIAFLMSPGGDYITGTTIVVDGGFDLAGPGTAFG